MCAAIDGATSVVSPTLVGRRNELSALIAAVVRAPAVVSVEGEAGVGKTRLVTELLARPELAGCTVLVGRCHPIRESFPLGPVVDAVQAIGAGLGELGLSAVAGALRPLLPELGSLLPDLPDPLGDPMAERHRVFRGLTAILAGLGRTALVLEDLHWADEQTLDFVQYLLAVCPPDLAVVLTYRSEEADADVRALTAKVPVGLARAHLTLTAFDVPETGELAAAIVGADRVSDEFAGYLHERTSGVPFAVEEVLALVRAKGLVVQTATGWARRTLEHLGVPRGIRDSTLARLARLPSRAQRTAETLAVLQTPVAPSVLAAMTGQADAAEALDEAIGSGLLVEAEETIGFRHILAAQAVYENITGPRRRALHASAATALQTLRPVPLGRVAHHLKSSGQLGEWAVAAEAAADQAVALGNDTEAARLLQDVLRNAPLELDQRGRVGVKLARAAIQTLHAHDIAGLLAQVLQENPPDPVVRGETRMLLANVLNQEGTHLPRQRELFAQAADELAGRPDLQAWAMTGSGLPIYPGVPVTESLAWMKRALALADETGDRTLRVFLAGKAAAVHVLAGDPAWRKMADDIRSQTGDDPGHRREVNAFYTLGVEAGTAGHLRVARVLLGIGLNAKATQEMGKLELMLRSALALQSYYSGDWNGLAEQASELIESQPGVPFSRVDVELAAGGLALAHGEADMAVRQLTDLIDAVERSGQSWLLPAAADVVTRALLSRDEGVAAAAVAQRCLDALAGKELWLPVARMLPSAAEAMIAAGDRPKAKELVDRAELELRGLDAPLAPAAVRYARSVLDESAQGFIAAAGLYEQVLAPYEAARAHEQAARVLTACGNGRAADQVQIAAHAYERLGATWDYARLTGLAKTAGMRLASHRRGRTGYGAQLSPRERQVAVLAAKGLSNNAIARELFVSVSTVEKQLGAAKRKLHARSRAEMAQRLNEAQ